MRKGWLGRAGEVMASGGYSLLMDYQRLTINVRRSVMVQIEEAAEKEGVTVTEFIRRAIAVRTGGDEA